ncbi:MAG: thiopeptide-type bacteriocin biosynthesis protein [Methanobacterium sp.]
MENSRSQLSDKYRVHRKIVEKLLEASDQKHQALHTILAARSKTQKSIGSQIGQLAENEETLNRLLSSYTHMMINRWFRSKQRMLEAVVYDFLLKFYKSKSARTEKS